MRRKSAYSHYDDLRSAIICNNISDDLVNNHWQRTNLEQSSASLSSNQREVVEVDEIRTFTFKTRTWRNISTVSSDIGSSTGGLEFTLCLSISCFFSFSFIGKKLEVSCYLSLVKMYDDSASKPLWPAHWYPFQEYDWLIQEKAAINLLRVLKFEKQGMSSVSLGVC